MKMQNLLGPTAECLIQQVWAGAESCISSKLPGCPDAGPGSTLWEPLVCPTKITLMSLHLGSS